MAAMLSINYQFRPSIHRRPNGTQVRRNLLKKANSRSGTKKSRQMDTAVGQASIDERNAILKVIYILLLIYNYEKLIDYVSIRFLFSG